MVDHGEALANAIREKLRKLTSDEVIVEFRKGDELPVTFAAEGDFVETTKPATSYVGVKRDFWLKLKNDKVQMSFDGTTYKEISEVVTGNLSANANSGENGGIANTIQVVLKAHLK